METLLTVKSSRISSLKSLFFPMKYDFIKDEGGSFIIIMTTRNWIGQKTSTREITTKFSAKGIILRKLNFSYGTSKKYGRFWFTDCKKVKRLMEQEVPLARRAEWSDTWF